MTIAYNFPTGQVFQEFSQNQYSGVLMANSAQSLTVPGGSTLGRSTAGSHQKVICIITINAAANVWVGNNATATVPGSSITSTSSELIPASGVLMKEVKIGDILSFITSSNNIQYGVAFYQSM